MKTFLITGANSGIGKALAIIAAEHQHRLILLLREENSIKPLTDELKLKTHNQNIEGFACDLSSQIEIEKCFNEIEKTYSSIDILINNAAIYTETRTETISHIELNLAVNVLAPFSLTQKLLPLLEKGDNPSVYNISSIGEKYGKVDFNDIQSKKNYSGNAAYNKSKLLLTMLTYKFAELYSEKNITFNCIHPGATRSNLVSQKDISKMPFLLRFVFKTVKGFRKKPANSAKKIYEIMTKAEILRANGKFFSNGKEVKSSKQSRDKKMINKTWELCLKLTQ